MISTFITLSPFLALPYIIAAVIQRVRGIHRIGLWGTLLAYVAVLVPLTALALDTINAQYQALLPAAILANAVIVLVISLVVLVLDYRREERDLNHSYGVMGLGVAALLLAGTVTTPLILSLLPVTTTAATALSTGASSQTDSSLQRVLTAQTGLSFDNIQSQMENGTSLAALIEANGGSTEAATSALTQAINEAIDSGAVPQQMLQRMGGEAAALAAQIVSGELPPQMAGRILGTFTGQGVIAGPGAGGFPGGAPPDGAMAGMSEGAANISAPPNMQAADENASAEQPQNLPAATISSETTADQASPPTSLPASPTPAPTSTSAPLAALGAEEPTALPTDAATPAPATCPLVVNFNLNLRAQPNSDGDLITTIPFGSVVQSIGQNAAGWWQVSYGRSTGWVSGEYVTPGSGCANLPTLSQG